MRRGVLLAVLVLLAVAVPAQAHPVSVHQAERAISHWWRGGAQKPRGEWCVRKHYGDICSFSTGFDKSGPFAADVTGRDTFIVWVSRTHDRATVAVLGESVRAVISSG